MTAALRVLIVEDSEDDTALILRELRRGGYAPEHRRVDSAESLEQALAAGEWDVVISDFALPGFSGASALELVKWRGLDIPFIIVSGVIGEETAVAAMKAGAHDYVMKSSLGRLVPAVRREIQEAEVRRAKRRSEQALREAHGRLRALSSRMMRIQENERRTIARELHDEIGQALTAVKISLQSLLLEAGSAGSARRIEEGLRIVDRALEQVRSLSLDLRPSQLDDLGLTAALRWYLDRQSRLAGFEVRFGADPLPGRLHPEIETTCFRIAQEALTNVLRHAGARRVSVELRRRDAELELAVEDDGRGFDVAAARWRAARGASLGLASMEERAALAGGRLELASAPGEGTKVRVRLPLAPDLDEPGGRNGGEGA
ncbi:MAG TPA: ATP-binding protein [Burkholderiales bacterium]|nr:ATP-binding protein [Burkholderiales bacterium]